MLLTLRRQNQTEDQIAERLEFDSKPGLTAVEVMYQWLRNLELPEWLVNTGAPGAGGESNRATGTKKPGGQGDSDRAKEFKSKNERKAQSTGDKVDLPPAARAAETFRWQIRRRSGTPPEGVNVLLKTLEEHVDELDELGERLHGERFLSAFRIEDEWESYDRTRFSEQEWKELCEEHGVDPTREEFVLSLEPYFEPLGAKGTPSPGLIQLIAMYALRNWSLEPLLDVLHPDPSEVDQAGLRKDIKEIRHFAGRIAKRVHGGTINDGGGRPAPPISRYELSAKWDCIDPLREEGCSDEEILDKLNAHRYSNKDGEAFSLNDVRRLAGLKLPPPF